MIEDKRLLVPIFNDTLIGSVEIIVKQLAFFLCKIPYLGNRGKFKSSRKVVGRVIGGNRLHLL